ncbi:polyribonucleotide nucleotidyltransferase, partial [Candidatus Berkelbacteria bacterium]|nr:polyribonucleotide nucleotidyltransferase [Candidatus Berkelbacteria bacterium]
MNLEKEKIIAGEVDFSPGKLTIETGELAALAAGAVKVTWGGTVVLAAVTTTGEPREGVDFFPLLVDFEERLYAAGKISGSRFIKREGKPSEEAVLAARLIDRPIRPLFPKSFKNDIQVVLTVLSYDENFDPDVAAMIAASAALRVAKTPFQGPIAAARVGFLGEQFVLNPSYSQREESALNLVVAGTEDKVLMLEGEARFLTEEQIAGAIDFALKHFKPILDLQNQLFPAQEYAYHAAIPSEEREVLGAVRKLVGSKIAAAARLADKEKREDALSQLTEELAVKLEGSFKQVDIKTAFDELVEEEVREVVLQENRRIDNRGLLEIRPLLMKAAYLPRTHGSALFSRGQTQVLSIVTLGGPGEKQVVETMEEEGTKRFMHHYNFPPFSTGEVKPLRSVSRREIGHGALVERSLLPILPPIESFPYTIRVVSEVLSSNGSTSMASVCASTLALMDAGVPIKEPVAGISIGLMSKDATYQPETYKLLVDIQGIEDFGGEMDFKVAGTKTGITGVQLDIKSPGLPLSLVAEALKLAHQSRLSILTEMEKLLAKPRAEISPLAPRLVTLKINPNKIGALIGPGGKVINRIINDAGGREVLSIDIEDDGTVTLSSDKPEILKKAVLEVQDLTWEPAVDEIYDGIIVKVLDFGAFVEIKPGIEGLIHISKLSDQRVERTSDIVKEGQRVKVKLLSVDDQGRLNFS